MKREMEITVRSISGEAFKIVGELPFEIYGNNFAVTRFPGSCFYRATHVKTGVCIDSMSVVSIDAFELRKTAKRIARKIGREPFLNAIKNHKEEINLWNAS
jgi:hypothetical protein